MAIVDDDMNEDSMYSTLLDINSNVGEDACSLEDLEWADSFINKANSNVGEDALSLEHLAWADSFINKDLDASDSDWSSIKDVLLEILSSQPGQNGSAVTEIQSQLMIDKDIHSTEHVTSLGFGRASDEDEDLIEDDFGDVESIENSDVEDNLVLVNTRRRLKGRNSIKNVFRPNYTEDTAKVEDMDSGMNPSLKTLGVESSSDDIFKVWDLRVSDVWDLGVSDEQDDFSKELSKAFGEFPKPVKQTQEDPWKDVMHVSMDNLIASLGDLSLKQNTK